MIQKELKDLCQRLRDNDPTLTSLNLDYANIGIEGARALRSALRKNKIVSSIHVHHANLGYDGARILLSGLKGRGVKTSVSLIDSFTEKEYKMLYQMVQELQKDGREQTESKLKQSEHGSKQPEKNIREVDSNGKPTEKDSKQPENKDKQQGNEVEKPVVRLRAKDNDYGVDKAIEIKVAEDRQNLAKNKTNEIKKEIK